MSSLSNMASHYSIIHFRVYYRKQFPVAASSHFGPQTQSLCRPITSKISAAQDDTTVSYLVNSCGLSPQSAIAASHKVKFQSLEKPESVLALLRDYEFSETQISNVVRKHPQILVADANQTLVPKLEFFCSLGVSRPELAKTLSFNPWLLKPSLEHCIKPSALYLRTLVNNDVKFMLAFRNKYCLLMKNVSKEVSPNIEFVRELGMPQNCIAILVTSYASCVMKRPEVFRELVVEVKEMGFDIEKTFFVQAMHALSDNKKSWKRNHEAYSRWGWSEDDILSAFRLFPLCMMNSEKKIMETMDFIVNKMGWQSDIVAKYPQILSFSLEKRTIPRCSVVRALLLKGLIDEDEFSWTTVFKSTENAFLDMFVTRYLKQVPQLLDVYHGGLDLQDVL